MKLLSWRALLSLFQSSQGRVHPVVRFEWCAHICDPSASFKSKKWKSDLKEMRAGALKDYVLGEKVQSLGEKSPRPLEKL